MGVAVCLLGRFASCIRFFRSRLRMLFGLAFSTGIRRKPRIHPRDALPDHPSSQRGHRRSYVSSCCQQEPTNTMRPFTSRRRPDCGGASYSVSDGVTSTLNAGSCESSRRWLSCAARYASACQRPIGAAGSLHSTSGRSLYFANIGGPRWPGMELSTAGLTSKVLFSSVRMGDRFTQLCSRTTSVDASERLVFARSGYTICGIPTQRTPCRLECIRKSLASDSVTQRSRSRSTFTVTPCRVCSVRPQKQLPPCSRTTGSRMMSRDPSVYMSVTSTRSHAPRCLWAAASLLLR
jgi:hypothetical protein